ncbi:MAG TPA: carboxymuconolactone decarboxylase family protein [Cyclobacteriaceae bacterium]
MSKRLSIGKIYPEAYKAMDALDNLVANSSLQQWHKEMIRIRTSYINGCAYCVDVHTQDALKLGIDLRKIALIPVWREAVNIFDVKEQTILLLTEEISLIHQKGISDEVYDQCINTFGERQTAELIMTIITINAWNRVGVGLKLEPQIG